MRHINFVPRARAASHALAASAAAWILALSLACSPAHASALPGYDYVSPAPLSDRISPRNNIALRRSEIPGEAAQRIPAMTVVGSVSGIHAGSWSQSDDGRTVVFTPATPFSPGETVNVRIVAPGVAAGSATAFHFSVAARDPANDAAEPIESSGGAPAAGSLRNRRAAVERLLASQPCDTMAVGYIPATLMNSNNPDPGNVFLSLNDTNVAQSPGHLTILDNYAVPIFHRPVSGGANDLEVQPNGLLTYFATTRHKYYALDSTYALVDSFATGNGYTTDGHELLLLPNGHALLMAYDPQHVGMDTVVTGGNPNATVYGLILQELDAAKNVVFQWRSWDHWKITDMVEVPGRLLTGLTIDYSHGNSLEQDLDGNLIVSSRHMNEITKIDRLTGAIIWRMGRNAKNNDFTFPNDPRGFAGQHDVRRLPNGHITMFDNGLALSPIYSRALEYSLDETSKIATEVWEFRNTPDNYGFATGSVRRRANGATMIGWGLRTLDPKVTDLHLDGTKAFELGFGDTMIFSYRAEREPWRTTLFVPDAQSLDFGTIAPGGTGVLPVTIHNNSAAPLELTCFASSDPTVSVVEGVPATVPASGNTLIHVQFAPTTLGTVNARLYVRSVHGTELVAQPIAVTGTGGTGAGVGGTPGVNDARVAVAPNPGIGARVLAFELPEAGRATLEIFDLGGRRVATPFDGSASQGRHEIVWTATSRGMPLQGGVYFVKLTSARGVRTVKLVQLSR